jgi:ABC-type phosphate transport system permease subunit
MFADIIRLLIALSCALFVLSLPVAKTTLGQTLRRAAGFCFLLAFLPSLIYGLFFSAQVAPGTTSTAGQATSADHLHHFLANLGCVAVFAILAVCAYALLQLRARFRAKSKPRDPWDTFFNRGRGKKRVNPNGGPAGSAGP